MIDGKKPAMRLVLGSNIILAILIFLMTLMRLLIASAMLGMFRVSGRIIGIQGSVMIAVFMKIPIRVLIGVRLPMKRLVEAM